MMFIMAADLVRETKRQMITCKSTNSCITFIITPQRILCQLPFHPNLTLVIEAGFFF